MITLRLAEERGHADHGWLNSYHTFSFANYHDPMHMGFRALRVLNDDRVAPGRGFGSHGHRDMEIISYVLEGALEHRDSMGNGSVIRPGDVQRMSAGTGVTHSEYNASRTSPVHFLQIWLLPARPRLPSGYEQKHFTDDDKRGRLRLVASPDGADGSVRIQQDARMFAALLGAGQAVSHDFAAGRLGWLHVARGVAEIGGTSLRAGDGIAIRDEPHIAISSSQTGELLLFDLPAQ
jgi:redox-sensitive bicupin YhaK (pirin superfamily)